MTLGRFGLRFGNSRRSKVGKSAMKIRNTQERILSTGPLEAIRALVEP
jgi:hypothetical protein